MPRIPPQPGRGATRLERNVEIAEQGSYSSDDSRTAFEWGLPEWGAKDRALCRAGLHMATRRPVVTGWISYFTSVERWYCACGAKCWIKYDGSFVADETTVPGGHLHWIKGHVEMQSKMRLHREWEHAMSDSHPCWGDYRKCISCGCTIERPCVSHVGCTAPRFDAERMEAARNRQEELRSEMWPKE